MEAFLILNVLMTYFLRQQCSGGGSEEEKMPPGKKAKKKQQQRRNRKRRQLLERSRRSRDDLINSALEETDVVAFIPTPRGSIFSLSHHSTYCETSDLPPFSTPCGDGVAKRSRTLFVNSTPRRRMSYSPSPNRNFESNLSASSLLDPLISAEDQQFCNSDDETDRSTAVQLAHISSSNDKPDKTDLKFQWFTNFKVAVVTLLNTISSYFWKMYFSLTSVRISEDKPKSPAVKKQDDVASKLDEILNCMTELSMKQDQFYERQENLFNRMAALEARCARSAIPPLATGLSSGGPPPPPPPMPKFEISATPQPLEIVKKSQDLTTNPAVVKPSRPSITLEDILGVQLKKTPAVKPFSERTPTKASTGPRGPLVSVDMLRSVKLKPAMMRRQSLERPLQTPSSIFHHHTRTHNSDIAENEI
ncbi:uncharacterized protein LOC132196292 isoform X2 [Neocloeon triangulifer]|uniref:uncharacterized protein LOC132196292 isoform X2 n=1 Tax=Neocloeon triangulifer TaxID=2078957 RepID=UPI00286F8BF2|nr:uncharacterized protein LOC132196292 isoform X2 [Neocloeon triangulifer]